MISLSVRALCGTGLRAGSESAGESWRPQLISVRSRNLPERHLTFVSDHRNRPGSVWGHFREVKLLTKQVKMKFDGAENSF